MPTILNFLSRLPEPVAAAFIYLGMMAFGFPLLALVSVLYAISDPARVWTDLLYLTFGVAMGIGLVQLLRHGQYTRAWIGIMGVGIFIVWLLGWFPDARLATAFIGSLFSGIPALAIGVYGFTGYWILGSAIAITAALTYEKTVQDAQAIFRQVTRLVAWEWVGFFFIGILGPYWSAVEIMAFVYVGMTLGLMVIGWRMGAQWAEYIIFSVFESIAAFLLLYGAQRFLIAVGWYDALLPWIAVAILFIFAGFLYYMRKLRLVGYAVFLTAMLIVTHQLLLKTPPEYASLVPREYLVSPAPPPAVARARENLEREKQILMATKAAEANARLADPRLSPEERIREAQKLLEEAEELQPSLKNLLRIAWRWGVQAIQHLIS